MKRRTGQNPTIQVPEQAQTQPSTVPHVIIVGGGFGGLQAAKALGKQALQVTVIDQNNFHLFQPMLYQVGKTFAVRYLQAGGKVHALQALLGLRDWRSVKRYRQAAGLVEQQPAGRRKRRKKRRRRVAPSDLW